MILPLDREQTCASPVPVRAILALAHPRTVPRRQSVRIEPLSQHEAFLELSRHTFNYSITDAPRLQRQFRFATDLASSSVIGRLAYGRSIDEIESVRDQILAFFPPRNGSAYAS